MRCPGDYPGRPLSCLCRDLGSYDNGHGWIPRHELRALRAEQRIEKLLAPYRCSPITSGDPRGACVKLRVPSGRTDDWGQTGLCVPTR